MFRRFWIRLALLTGTSALALMALMWWANGRVAEAAAGRVYTRLEDLPARPVALVLGTSKYSRGRLNSYYVGRIRAAAELYHSGKVAGILVSGDNGSASYNEPAQMMADLVALGVSAEHITADYAGFRTLDSIYRAGDVFGLDSYVIVTQAFHLPRALYLAQRKGHDAVGYAAPGPRRGVSPRLLAREVLARSVAVLDTAVLNRGPRYLGEPVEVRLRNSGL
ncbi:MAG: YdcF family protein [Caldilineales bacterium]|nr:YdcF family protein [Caldilineales bacterium]MDW8319522.1 ElyC/SanA/YdcF family protein [Anaerolineae bacterium]